MTSPVPHPALAASISPDEEAYHLLYLQSFGAWVWLSAFGLIALAILLWALFGTWRVQVNGTAQVQGNQAHLVLTDQVLLQQVRAGQETQVQCAGAEEGSGTASGRVIAVDDNTVHLRLNHPVLPGTSTSCSAAIAVAHIRPIERILP